MRIETHPSSSWKERVYAEWFRMGRRFRSLERYVRQVRKRYLYAGETKEGGTGETKEHDLAGLVSHYTLLDAQGVYCGVPADIRVCEGCLARNPHKAAWNGEDIVTWRERWKKLLALADRVLLFSEASAQIVYRVFPLLREKSLVRPHALGRFPQKRVAIDCRNPMKIGVVGGLNFAKGAEIVRDLCALLPKGIEVVLVGESDSEIRGLRVWGRYRREELPEILEKEGITVCLFSSVCPETFSYVTSELMALGMPVACFDFGAQAEKTRDYPLGTVIPEVSAKAALEALTNLHCRSAVLQRELRELP